MQPTLRFAQGPSARVLMGSARKAPPDGAAALAHLRAAARLPCVILLDLMMPGMNGYQFRAAQLEDPALARIPVILLTADVMIKEKAAALRVAACLRKPVGVAELCAAIHRHCRCE